MKKLVRGVDYYMEGTKLVFTAEHLLARGFCCNSRCRHCPYGATSAAPSAPIVVLPPTLPAEPDGSDDA
jgi:hypothetical protein